MPSWWKYSNDKMKRYLQSLASIDPAVKGSVEVVSLRVQKLVEQPTCGMIKNYLEVVCTKITCISKQLVQDISNGYR